MSDPLKKTDEAPAQAPAALPEDLIPVWLWLRENGAQWLMAIAVGVLLAVGISFFLRNREERAARGSAQLLTPPSTDALEKTAQEFSGTPAGTAAQLKLAKAYCDAGQYEKALAEYDTFLRKHASFPFADIARVGRGVALGGLSRSDEAVAIFRSFRGQNPGHYLVPQTMLGEAACLAQQGKKDAAKALLQELRAANRETPWESAAKRMEDALDRYQGTRPGMRSLLEQANALAPMTLPAAKTAPAPTK